MAEIYHLEIDMWVGLGRVQKNWTQVQLCVKLKDLQRLSEIDKNLSLRRKVAALRDADVLLSVRLSVCLSPTHAVPGAPAGRSDWATRTTGVPDISSRENITP